MSAISEKVGAALYSALNVAGVTNLVSTRIYQDRAPAGAALPYLVYQRFAPGNVVYTLKQNLICEDDEWLIKALTDEDSSETLSPSALMHDILIAAETAIGSTLTVSGQNVWFVERIADIPPYTEELSDRVIYHGGFRLRVVVN